MNLSPRQKQIIELVREGQPITSEIIAKKLGVTRAALRADLAILTSMDILEAKPKVGYIYTNKPINSMALNYINNISVEHKITYTLQYK